MSVLLHRAWAVVSNPLSFVSLVQHAINSLKVKVDNNIKRQDPLVDSLSFLGPSPASDLKQTRQERQLKIKNR